MKRMKKKTAVWILAMAVLLALLSANASALGITPARTVLGFEPGQTKDIRFTILNNENKGMKVLVYSDDENAKFLELKPTVLEFRADEPSKDFTTRFRIAGQVLRPGMNEVGIKILELPEGYGEEDAAKISATMELIHQIRVNVPYPGKYAEADIYITSDDAGRPVLFTMPVFNRGRERLESIKAHIDVYDVNGNLVASADTNEISIEPGREGKVAAELAARLGRGRYRAKARLEYDGQPIDIEKEFFVATPLVSINGVIVDSSFRLGSIAKFAILLENMWNQRIENVYGSIKIRDESNMGMASFKTASTDMDANSIGKLDAYWDTKDISPGLYRMHIALRYLDIMNEKVFDMDVGFDSISIREYGATGAVVAGKGEGVSRNMLLAAAVFMLVVINAALFLHLRRRRRMAARP